MKIGIFTYHAVHNFGAFLQSRALCLRLNEEKDIDAEIINFRLQSSVNEYELKRKYKSWIKHPETISFDKAVHRSFVQSQNDGGNILSADSAIGQSCEDFCSFVKDKYDVIIAGSDEIWKISDSLHFPNPFWLCGDLGARKFAYAASSRSKLSELSEEKYARLRAILDDFEYIGVRDKPTFDEISAATSDPTKVRMNPDPSFIYKYDVTDKAYLALRKKYRIPDNKKTALIMTKNKSIAKLIRNSLGKEYALVSVFHHQHGCINVGELRPFEWLSLIRYSDFVLTTYFHASCFSIIYDTPFIAFGDRNKSSKLAPLFEEFSLSDRYFPDSSQLSDLTENVKRLSSHPDMQELVEKKRIEFEEFINALRKK